MADLRELATGQRVRVNGAREVAGTMLPLWCNELVGTVLRFDGEMVMVRLENISARELRFHANELDVIG